MGTSKRQKHFGKMTRGAKRMKSVDYVEYLIAQLKDLEYASGYLTACLEEGADVFLEGIRKVALAQGGMKALSDATKINRETPMK
jgi:DNA-binding phage protein